MSEAYNFQYYSSINVFEDKYFLIHRTNLPKPTMELQGFPVPREMPSFPSWNIYYDYIKAYAAHFDLHKHIKVIERPRLA